MLAFGHIKPQASWTSCSSMNRNGSSSGLGSGIDAVLASTLLVTPACGATPLRALTGLPVMHDEASMQALSSTAFAHVVLSWFAWVALGDGAIVTMKLAVSS